MSRSTKGRLAEAAILLLFGLGWLTASAARQVLAADEVFVRPLNGSAILRFGKSYVDAISGKSHSHHGLDIGASAGARATAAADGRVAFAGHTPLGYCVSIKHSNGVKTTYLPLDKLAVGSGDAVQRGQTIGYVAQIGDGSSAATHLHLGALFAGKYIDPETLFRGEFRADYSRLIRRGDIPPEDKTFALAGFTAAAGASVWEWPARFWSGATAFISGCFTAGEVFYDRLLDTGDFTIRWLWSIAESTGLFLGRQSGRSFVGRTLKLPNRPEYRLLFGSGPSAAVASGGIRLFDPSGDTAYPLDRISVPLDDGRRAIGLDIYDSDGVRIRAISVWDSGLAAIVWTGEDSAGRIVADGLYTLILRRVDGSVSASLAEVRWHQ